MNKETGWSGNIQNGDWVRGKSVNDELFRGYIESIDYQRGTVKVRVTECDHESTVGKIIETLFHKVEKLPLEIYNQEGQILNLIDFALLTGDKSWFMELTNKLKEIRQAEEKKETDQKDASNPGICREFRE